MKTTERKNVGPSGRSGLRIMVMMALGLAVGATPAALAQDCNSDGIPDSQQLTTPVELRSGPVDHFNTPSFANYTYRQVPAAIGDVTVSLLGRNNLDELDEFGNFFINDVLVAGSLWAETGEFCSLGTWESVVIDEATWNDLRALGNGDMAMRVRYFQGPEHCGHVKTRFNADYMTSNDCDGDGLLNECENEDCDGNGVFDGCQHDADGDGVINTCDLCPDFDDAIDADGDTIPDACERCPGADDTRDCNNDGVPDCLQLTATFSYWDDSWATCTPNTAYYPPLDLPEAIGDVTVTYLFTWTENVYDADKWIDVTLNGTSVGRLFDSTWACGDFLYEEITIPATVWNAQRSTDGPTEMYLLRNAASCAGTGNCAEWFSQFVEYWTVEYEYSTDVDGDGWLDGCIPGGDPSGPDTDGDGVSDNIDRSPNTIADPSLVDVYGRLMRVARFDADEDGDVDAADFDLLDAFDRDVDGDGDADLHDLASILHGARGPGVAADPAFLQELQLFKAHTFGPEDLDLKPWYLSMDGVYYASYNNCNLLSQALYGTHLAAIDKTGASPLSQAQQIAQINELMAASGSAMSWIGMKWSRADTSFIWENGQFFDTNNGSVSNWILGGQIPGSGFFTPGQDDYYVFNSASEGYRWLNGDGITASLGEQAIEGFVAQLPENTVPAAPTTTTETVTVILESSANGQAVAPGATVDWTISFQVSTGDNSGLALLVTDLVQNVGNPESFDLPVGDAAPVAMQNFAAPLGFTGPGGYGGQPTGTAGALDLAQIGGAQNTFGDVSSDTSHGQGGSVVAGVGQSGSTVMATGSFTAPSTFGSYTFNLDNTLASVLKSVGGPGMGSEIVPANVGVTQSAISFTVADLCVDADNCASAIPISDGIIAGCSRDATNDGNATCGNSNSSPDVWYLYTATCDGVATAQTCSAATTFDTVLSIVDGCGGSELACNDDGCGGTSTTSLIAWPVTSGGQYLIRVSGYNGANGEFELEVGCAPDASNDDCANATPLAAGTYSGSTTNATIDGTGPCGTTASRDVWFVYTNDVGVDAEVTVDLCSPNTTFDTVLGVYDGCGGAEIACNDDAENCGANGSASMLTWIVPCGETHLIQIASYGDLPGDFQMNVSVTPVGLDSDGDGVGDTCDVCSGFDDSIDADSDGIPDGCDPCPDYPNVHNVTQDLYYATIQEAIDGAMTGDVIQIAPCTFHEDNIMLPNGIDLTLRGAGAGATVIDGGGADDSNPIIRMELSGQTSATLIENLTLRNGRATGDLGSGLYIRGTSPTVRMVHIEDCSGVASLYVHSSNSLFDRCVISGHTDSFATTYTLGGNPLFLQCLIADNTPGFAEVRRYGVSGVATFVSCTIRGGHPLVTFAGGQIDSFNTIIDGPISGDGIVSMVRCLYVGATGDNIDGAPTYVDAASGDYRLAAGSLGIDAADYDVHVAVGGGATDLNGDPRTFDSCIDDTGFGTLTYLDMGAYETQDDGIDSDGNGVPDVCETSCGGLQLGDVDANGFVEFADAAAMSAMLLDPTSGTADQQCAADVNQDGSVNGLDIQAFIGLLLMP